MPQGAAPAKQLEIGTYTCPNTGKRLPLVSEKALMEVVWPVVVRQCSACGETHTVQRQDVARPPVFGYE